MDSGRKWVVRKCGGITKSIMGKSSNFQAQKTQPPCNLLICVGKTENYNFDQILLGSNQARYLTIVLHTPVQNKQDRWTRNLISDHIHYEAHSQSQLINYIANQLPNGALPY